MADSGTYKELTLTELVKNTTAYFTEYRDGELWYNILRNPGGMSVIRKEDRDLFAFPIPVKDVGTGHLPARVKAITLMRWIRKHQETVQKWNEERNDSSKYEQRA